MWFSILFGLCLCGLSAIMLMRNRAAWRTVDGTERDEGERSFQQRQYRRRGYATALIGVVGLSIILSVWVPDSTAAAFYWIGVILLVCWMALLAVADLIATRSHFNRLLQDQRDERLVLEAELDQIRRHQGNGQAKPSKDSQ